MEKRESFCSVGQNANWYSHYGEQYAISLKTWNKTIIWPSSPTTCTYPQGNHNWKRHKYLMFIAALFTVVGHKRLWCWEGLGSGEEGDNRGWDGWMASPTRWTWVWVNSGSWWWTGRPGVLQFMGSQRVGHDWATELTWRTWKQPRCPLTDG